MIRIAFFIACAVPLIVVGVDLYDLGPPMAQTSCPAGQEMSWGHCAATPAPPSTLDDCKDPELRPVGASCPDDHPSERASPPEDPHAKALQQLLSVNPTPLN